MPVSSSRIRCTRPLVDPIERHLDRAERILDVAAVLAISYLTLRAFLPFVLALLGWRTP